MRKRIKRGFGLATETNRKYQRAHVLEHDIAFEDMDLRIGGIYFVDDLLPQPNWPAGHAPKVSALVAELESRRDFVVTKLAWSTGLMLLVRINHPGGTQ